MKLLPDDLKLNPTLSEEFDYEKVYKECFVDVTKALKPPPIALGIGYHSYGSQSYLNSTFTYGEISAIIAPQKSKKTFFRRALIASYIGGNANEYFPSLISCRKDDKYVLDFDTEQDNYYAQRSFKGVMDMVGSHYPNYLPFGLKRLTDDQRVEFIDCVVNDPRYKGKIGWISIDGVADLCWNTNDMEKSKVVAQKIQAWGEGCHVCTVIHKTFDKDKGTGHLGTIIQNKAETTVFLKIVDMDVYNSPVEVRQRDARGASFETFYFDLNLNTVTPKECKNEWPEL